MTIPSGTRTGNTNARGYRLQCGRVTISGPTFQEVREACAEIAGASGGEWGTNARGSMTGTTGNTGTGSRRTLTAAHRKKISQARKRQTAQTAQTQQGQGAQPAKTRTAGA